MESRPLFPVAALLFVHAPSIKRAEVCSLGMDHTNSPPEHSSRQLRLRQFDAQSRPPGLKAWSHHHRRTDIIGEGTARSARQSPSHGQDMSVADV